MRLLPIVRLARGRGAIARTYEEVIAEGGEGVVVVDLTAPLGKRGAKKKLKPVTEIDAVVLASDRHAATVAYRGRTFHVATTRQPQPGEVVEILHDGVYASGEPRFARVTRVRTDLQIGNGNARAAAAWGARW